MRDAIIMLHLRAGMHPSEACRPLLRRLLDMMQIQVKGQRQSK